MRRLTGIHWAWIHAKFAMTVWACLLFAFTPAAVTGALSTFLVAFVCGCVVVGNGVGVTGLVLSATSNVRRKVDGYSVELTGIVVAAIGPICYGVTQATLIGGPAGQGRVHLVALAYALLSFLIVRYVLVRHARKKATT